MPSVKETDEESPLIKRTQDYRDLLQNKIGSDSFNNRAAQTFNLTLKPKEITFDISHVSKSDNQQQQRDLFSYRMVTTRDQSLQASTYEIDDECKKVRDTESVKMKKEYDESIQEIMKVKEKSLRNLIDPDKMTS